MNPLRAALLAILAVGLLAVGPITCAATVVANAIPTPPATPTPTPAPTGQDIVWGVWANCGGHCGGNNVVAPTPNPVLGWSTQTNLVSLLGKQTYYGPHYGTFGQRFPSGATGALPCDNVGSDPPQGSCETFDYAAVQQANDPNQGAPQQRLVEIALSGGGGNCNAANAITNINNNTGGWLGNGGLIAGAVTDWFYEWENAGHGVSVPNANQYPVIVRPFYEFNGASIKSSQCTPYITNAQFNSGMQAFVTQVDSTLTQLGCGPSPFNGVTGPATYPTCNRNSVVLLAWCPEQSAYNPLSGSNQTYQYWPGLSTADGMQIFPIVAYDAYSHKGVGLSAVINTMYNDTVTAATFCGNTNHGCVSTDGTSITTGTGSPLPYLVTETASEADGGADPNTSPEPTPPATPRPYATWVPNQGNYLVPNYTSYGPYPTAIDQADLKAHFPNMQGYCKQGNGTQVACGGIIYFASDDPSSCNYDGNGCQWAIRQNGTLMNLQVYGLWMGS